MVNEELTGNLLFISYYLYVYHMLNIPNRSMLLCTTHSYIYIYIYSINITTNIQLVFQIVGAIFSGFSNCDLVFVIVSLISLKLNLSLAFS